MVAVQTLLSLVLPFAQQPLRAPEAGPANVTKSLAIIGGGSAGLAMLKTLLDLPLSTRQSWEITLYEERHGVGGVWLPQPHPPAPPDLPETALYPLLRTNTPVPSMTYPHFPFPPGTPLYPRHEHVERYLRLYAEQHELRKYIRFNHSVERAWWNGTADAGHWELTVRRSGGEEVARKADHLVVATGNNRYPHIPEFEGQELWLSARAGREVMHSVWYRGPEPYTNRTVVIVGAGASGRDAAEQVSLFARKTYHSARNDPLTGEPPLIEGTISKPEISRFTAHGIEFADGTTASDVDAVLLGTGYDHRKPLLERGHALAVEPGAHTNTSRGLLSNLRYLFPLHRHIFALCEGYPPTALAFIGLPSLVANCPSDTAQAMLVAHAIANPRLLPSREEMLDDLSRHEDELREWGWDPYVIGHRLVNGTEFSYQDGLVDFLKERGAIPDDGRKFVEEWRKAGRTAYDYRVMKRGWLRIEELGTEKEWLDGVRTEAEWAQLMRRVSQWQKRWEEERSLALGKHQEG